jgi:uncharacterized protein YhaN
VRIKSVETAGFGGIPDRKLEFGEGLTVIKGANEAGKSFTIKAICQGLYGDASTSAREIREYCRKWNSGGPFLVRIELEEDGVTYILERDFEKKRNSLRINGGGEIRDKREISRIIAGMVGLPTERAFTATACIRQEEVESLSEERTSVRKIVEGRIAGSGSDTEKTAKKLAAARDGIRSRSGRKGLLVDVEKEIEELERDLRDKEKRLEALAADKKNLARVKSELERSRSALADKSKALENHRRYLEAMENEARRDKELEAALGDLYKCREAKKTIEDAAASLERIKKRLQGLDEEIEKAESFDAADRLWNELENDHRKLRKRYEEVRALDARISEISRELNTLVAVDAEELRSAGELAAEIKSLRKVLEGQSFSLEVRPEKDTEFSITADGKKVEGPRAEARGEAVVEFPGVAAVHIKNLAGDGEPVVDKIRRAEEALRTILDKYGVRDVEALRELERKRGEKENERKGLERERASLLGEETLEELEARLRETAIDLDEAGERRNALAGHAVPGEELERKKAERRDLAERERKLSAIASESRGILSVVGEDEGRLEERVNECTKELLVAREDLGRLVPFRCTPDEFTRLEREVKELGAKVKLLERDEAVLTERIDRETTGEEDVAVVQERLALLRERRKRLLHKYELLGVIAENLAWARERSISGFSKSIEERMGGILSRITGGKYSRVEVDGNLGVKVFSEEKGGYLDLDDKDEVAAISSGTLDQVYLAARLAVLEGIAGNKRPPLILDDTFASFDDMGRKRNAFELLKSIAQDRQVLYFTCHDCPDDVEVIEIQARRNVVLREKAASTKEARLTCNHVETTVKGKDGGEAARLPG